MLIQQFFRFSMVGIIGFLVDVTALYSAMHFLGLGLYSGRLFSYVLAASSTWALNRLYTFSSRPDEPKITQWSKFLAVNAIGGGINYAVYALLVSQLLLFSTYPALAVAAGSVTGLLFNFTACRRLIFIK